MAVISFTDVSGDWTLIDLVYGQWRSTGGEFLASEVRVDSSFTLCSLRSHPLLVVSPVFAVAAARRAMLQANPNASVLTVSPPESGFSPRREFVRESHVISSFALLSIAGAGSVRLTSFRREIISALRMCFISRGILRSLKEDKSLCVFEFSLQNKPWASSKNIESEKLFVDILAIIYLDGYKFISTLDYGRESDERTCMAFSRPAPSGDSRLGGPVAHPPLVHVPFAISFPSSTVLRVINPPRTSTPAILTGVRDAWPRGVVDERKIAGECFEFKLRGYKWFQEDTFSTDSLKHILALLASLDESSSSLVTSISLSGSRSRVKDLWIFIGPPQEMSDVLSNSSIELVRTLSPSGSLSALRAVAGPDSSPSANNSADTLHKRGGSATMQTGASSPLGMHGRSATEPVAQPITRSRTISPRNSRTVLRKKGSHQGHSPPSSIHGDLPLGHSSMDEIRLSGQRTNFYSADGTDMTGIGSGGLRNFATRSVGDLSRESPIRGFADPSQNPLRPSLEDRRPKIFLAEEASHSGRVKTGDLFYETGPPGYTQQEHPREHAGPSTSSPGASTSESGASSRQLTPRDQSTSPADVPQSVYEPAIISERSSSSSRQILGSNVFRDSAFSSTTGHSYEVPIKWTGGPEGDTWRDRITVIPGLPFEHGTPSLESEEGLHSSPDGTANKVRRPTRRNSTPLGLPGAWQPSPIEERPEDQGGLSSPKEILESELQNARLPERKEVDAARVVSPTFADTPGATRRSETALYGMVSNQTQNQAPSPRPRHQRQSSDATPSSPVTGSGGWVLVSFADGSSERPSSGSIGEGSLSAADSYPRQRTISGKKIAHKIPEQQASLHPVTKMIAAADALSSSSPAEKQSSTLKRFFVSSKSKSQRLAVDKQTAELKTVEDQETVETVRKASLRDRWRRRG